MSASHLSTQQWQSFETRMRHRRAERCVLRAEAAIQSGDDAAAREALAEAKQLDWNAPEFETVRASFLSRQAEVEAAAAAEAAALRRAARKQGARRAVAAAAIGIAVFGGSAALVYRASGSGSAVASAPLTLASPLPTSSASASPISATPPDLSAAVGEGAQTQPSGPGEPPVGAPTGTGTKNQVVAEPVAPSQELPASRTAPGMTGDIPVQTAGRPIDAPAVATPTFGASPFSTAPGSVTAVPLPPVAPADDAPPRSDAAAASAPSLPSVAPESMPRAVVDEAARVRSVLSKYEAAYTGLDANAAQLIWPGVDGRSLARAFQGLESQRVSLGQCALAIDGATARADCDGSATWTPKIGGGSRTESRHWRFELQHNAGTWQILTASAR